MSPLAVMPRRQPGARITAERQPDLSLNVAEPAGASLVASCDPRERFGEDTAWAAGRKATEAPRLHLDRYDPPLPRPIGEHPQVTAMDAVREAAASWARRARGPGMGSDRQSDGRNTHVLNDQTSGDEGEKALAHRPDLEPAPPPSLPQHQKCGRAQIYSLEKD